MMDFNDSPEEAAFRAEARAWLQSNTPKNWRDILASDLIESLDIRRAWQAQKADAGWACIDWPHAYGGRGASPIQQAIWAQEEGELALLAMFTIIGTGMAGRTLMRYGTEEQKRTLLPRIARGDDVWCQLFSEPGAGSDLAGIRTRAERDGDHWIVNGQKIWTSFGHIADRAILVTRSDPDLPKHKGMTYFYIDMKSPGVEVRPVKQISGDAEFNEVFLTDVRVPDSQRLGAEGEGWQVALTTLMSERSSIGAAFSSSFEEMYAALQALTVEGIAALDHPVVCDRLAEFYVNYAGMRSTNLRALSALSRGNLPGPEASIGKLIMGKQRQDEASFLLDMQNYAGVLTSADDQALGGFFQKAFFRCAGNRIEGGTDEILRNIIAERILGLPPDIRIDKELPFRQVPSRAVD